ncbi:MAG: 23S rRNA (adenine(2503)-C(2))-methyltransferase RlmN [Clostridium sp.]|nr:23S rRNA (adenine(2503)-C(2))-methyltransferase RlmN [Clostridium sp.]
MISVAGCHGFYYLFVYLLDNTDKQMDKGKKALLGMTLTELQAVAAEMGMPVFAAKQMAQWMYVRKARRIEDMTNLSRVHRERLSVTYEIGCSDPVDCQRSVDGTVKYLFRTREGGFVETVYIPDGERATVCVSSQVGCKMNCRFCMTGKQGYCGSLSATDILNQFYSLPERDTLTNAVFMGQGEPFDNLDNVLRATGILTSAWGYAWSPKRITVSTVGLRKGMQRFLAESDCHLAVSLHNAVPQERAEMMPAERSFSIVEMIALLRKYDFSHQRRLSFEYIVFEGLNDDEAHARFLLNLLKGLECRVNLIRFHDIPGVEMKGVSDEAMIRFRDYLTRRGLFATIRASRGQDIFAACGLLSTAHQQEQNNQDRILCI